MERNPAYQTSASLIPSSSNPSYAGLNVTQVYEDVSALQRRVLYACAFCCGNAHAFAVYI